MQLLPQHMGERGESLCAQEELVEPCWKPSLAGSSPSCPALAQVLELPLQLAEVQALLLPLALLTQCSPPVNPAGPENKRSRRWRWDQLSTQLLIWLLALLPAKLGEALEDATLEQVLIQALQR